LIEGLLAALGASTVWSLNPAIISRFSRDIKPVVFAGLRALVASIPLLVFLRNIHVDSDIGLLVAITSALLGPGLGDALYAQAIRILGGSLAVVVGYTYIFVASVLSALFLGEKWGLTVIMGSILAFTGVVVGAGLTNRRTPLKLRGIIFALGAAMSWGVGTTLIRVALNYYDFTSLTAMRFLTVGVIFTIIGLKVEGGLSVNSRRNLILASTLSGVLGLMVGGLLFTYAIWSIGVTATVITTSLTPVLSQWTTRLIAGESIKANTVIGAVLVALGILVLYL
jgi:DME family drug/metabolite transporter